MRKTNQREFTLQSCRFNALQWHGWFSSSRADFFLVAVLRVDENILRLLNQQRQFPFIALNNSHIHTLLLSIVGTSVEFHGWSREYQWEMSLNSMDYCLFSSANRDREREVIKRAKKREKKCGWCCWFSKKWIFRSFSSGIFLVTFCHHIRADLLPIKTQFEHDVYRYETILWVFK